MVLLGLFAGLLADRDERIHWQPAQLWIDEYVGGPEPRLAPGSRSPLRLLPGMHDPPTDGVTTAPNANPS
jgi:hypothetical protein